MLGTLRANGWPRISPCELDLVDGQLLLGMMWHSPKALDLLRDPRCVLHSCTSDRMGTEGDFKRCGRGVDQPDPQVRDAYRAAVEARIGRRVRGGLEPRARYPPLEPTTGVTGPPGLSGQRANLCRVR